LVEGQEYFGGINGVWAGDSSFFLPFSLGMRSWKGGDLTEVGGDTVVLGYAPAARVVMGFFAPAVRRTRMVRI